MLSDLMAESLIKNFTLEEVTRGQEIPEDIIHNIIPTLSVLQQIRTVIMDPIFIHSTYRTPEYNKKVGGASNSMHLVFNAIDFTPYEYDYFSLRRLFDQINKGRFGCETIFHGVPIKVSPQMMGLGLYTHFIHIDTRGLLGHQAPARWHA